MKNNLLFRTIFAGVLAMWFADAHELSAQNYLLVCNKGDHTLGLIDPVAGKMTATVPEDGVTGHEVVASPDGQRAFVPIYGNTGVGHAGSDGQLIRVVNLAQRAVTGTVDLGKGLRPHCAVMGPKNGLLYVTTELGECVTVIDLSGMKLARTVDVPKSPQEVLVRPDGKVAYVSCTASRQVAEIDVRDWQVKRLIEAGPGADGLAWAGK